MNYVMIFSKSLHFILQGFEDFDWADDKNTRTTNDYCFYVGECLISWLSKKQSIVATFSSEAKYRASLWLHLKLFG
ncbi:hypothetical protein KP509_02G096700 [Ceratopteris richardii]|nr:hypothetical protein KP509_02G096700 [Ceratopteris richardii]